MNARMLLAVLCVLTPLAAISAESCDLEMLQDRVIERIRGEQEPALERIAFKAPPTAQATAPAAADATTTNADSPERPRWLALAIEQGFAGENDKGGVNISLSPIDWLQKTHSQDYFDSNFQYWQANPLRPLTGSLSLGNRGEALDSDGDGTPNDPSTAKALDDSVLFELQYRFWGTRDRREALSDRRFSSRYAAERGVIRARLEDVADAYTALLATPPVFKLFNAYFPDAETMLADGICNTAAASIVEAMSVDPATAAQALAVVKAENAVFAAMNVLATKIDTSWVWSVGVSALERKDYLGRDRVAVSLRGLKGVEKPGIDAVGHTWLFNLDHSVVEGLTPADKDMRSAEVRIEYVSAFSKGAYGPFEKARWAVSLAGEKNWNAPENARTSQAVLGLKLEVPVSKNITAPFSLRWSNRNELLQDEDEIVGHIGLSFDFESFFAGH